MRILFVCHGNTCRSPAAEALVRKMAIDAGLDLHLDSAGISADRLGAAPTPAMQDLAQKAGYNMAGLKARKTARTDYEDFDLIIGMDNSVVAKLITDRPAQASTRITGFMQYPDSSGPNEIADPWHTGDYPTAFDLIQKAAKALIVKLQSDQPRQ
ncbi:low molecular weight protein-tyrosine-phosphatase [Halocynthiibacter sp.]|uniref:low molecular weight protein-tyrosine-phosphatase n=1 Tax=Halocynthiibacter sp. TaxID=1979210 RepID=UPI003C38523D